MPHYCCGYEEGKQVCGFQGLIAMAMCPFLFCTPISLYPRHVEVAGSTAVEACSEPFGVGSDEAIASPAPLIVNGFSGDGCVRVGTKQRARAGVPQS